MKAVLFDQPGPPEVLFHGSFPDPKPGSGELLVRVRAAAMNRADLLQRKGQYPPPPGESPVLGLEIAGEVVQTGPDSGSWKPGDRVCGLVGGGAYAEYALLQAPVALPVPEHWDWAMAASVPEVYMTAWQSLFWLGRLVPGERLLIHAGASGVGTAAIQLAKAVGVRDIIVTASKSKHSLCYDLGASLAIDYREEDFEGILSPSLPENKGVDLIVDCIAGPYFPKNLEVLNPDGRLVILAMMGGARMEAMDLMPVLRKRLQITGTTLRNRNLEYKGRLAKEVFGFAWPLFDKGMLKPVIDRIFPMSEVVAAHRYMEENRNQGKIVLVW